MSIAIIPLPIPEGMAFGVAVLRIVLCLVSTVKSQSIEGLGVSGGSGPQGGIGDTAHPVVAAQSFITDALVNNDRNTGRKLARGTSPTPLNGWPSGASSRDLWNVTIDAQDGARQELIGFGHTWTDSAVIVFNSLDSDVLDNVMDDLFGQSGNNMGFMRHTIGSSDLSEFQYSYDDNGGQTDSHFNHFSLGTHGEQMLRMLARMGDHKSDVFLLGSPWSYPGWAKNNGLFVAPGVASNSWSNNSFDTRYTDQMNKYFTKYVDAFQTSGVTVNGITPMNEPLNYQSGYPTMYLPPEDEADLIKHGLGSEMSKRNVSIFAFDHDTYGPEYPLQVLDQEHRYVDGVAWHCYQSPVANYSVMDDIHAAYPNALQVMSECSNLASSDSRFDFAVAQNFILPVHHGASGASMWVMATDPHYGPHVSDGGCDTCFGSIIVNSSTTYTRTNDYYMIGQFSRYIRRGAINYNVLTGNWGNASTEDQFFLMAAQNPDKSWAVVFMNNMGNDSDVVLSFTGTDQMWQGTIPNATVVTWLLPPFDGEAAAPAIPSASNTPVSTGSGPAPSATSGANSVLSPYALHVYVILFILLVFIEYRI